jgi:hypothetical protein
VAALLNPSSAKTLLDGESTLKDHFKTLLLIYPVLHNALSPRSPMSASHPNSWTEPPWSGWIETTGDALLILEAARRGLIPRVTRRLVDAERKMITSGSVFVFDEDESGIKRWTDGFFWSPSRILGNFLLYRETDKKGAGNRGVRPDPVDNIDTSQYTLDGARLDTQTLSRPKSETGLVGVNRQRERTLMGSLTNSYKFKPDGLMKKVRLSSSQPTIRLTPNLGTDVLPHNRWRLTTPHLLLSHRRRRKRSSPPTLIPTRTSFSRH